MSKHRKFIPGDTVSYSGKTVLLEKVGKDMFDGLTVHEDAWEREYRTFGYLGDIQSLTEPSGGEY